LWKNNFMLGVSEIKSLVVAYFKPLKSNSDTYGLYTLEADYAHKL